MSDVSEITPSLDNAGQPLEYLATAGQEEEHLKRLAGPDTRRWWICVHPERPRVPRVGEGRTAGRYGVRQYPRGS